LLGATLLAMKLTYRNCWKFCWYALDMKGFWLSDKFRIRADIFININCTWLLSFMYWCLIGLTLNKQEKHYVEKSWHLLGACFSKAVRGEINFSRQ
jgi:hypothetical protein